MLSRPPHSPDLAPADFSITSKLKIVLKGTDRLCDLVVRVLGYKSGGPGSIPSTTRKKSSGYGTGSTQPREYN
jgi:hypothetical protein